MVYVILCYRDESVIDAACRLEESRIGTRRDEAVARLVEAGAIGISIRLLASTTSTTIRLLRGAPHVMDGPAIDTGLQLQGVYLANCASLDEALSVAGHLADLEPGGVYEVRPADAIVDDRRA